MGATLEEQHHRTRLIVGVDYGTTFSGLSFAKSTITDPNEISVWTRYNGSNQHKAENNCKAPSWIALPHENEEFNLERPAWGYEIEPGMKTHCWTKLLLDNKTKTTQYDDPKLEYVVGGGMQTLPSGWSSAELVSEYLRGMHIMLWDSLEETLGSPQLKIMPMDVWITVPAVWSEQAKLLTKNAATKAGFASRPGDSINIIAEPEAAAHVAIRTKLMETVDLIDDGSGLLVCDAGGGTVDITTYVLTSSNPRLVLDEIATGAGGKCGGAFIDRNLHDLLESRFGDIYTSVEEEDRGPGSSFMDFFEACKRDFSSKQPTKRPTRLPLELSDISKSPTLLKEYEQYYSAKSKRILLSHSDWKTLFDPVVNRVIELVSDQVEAASKTRRIKTLVLVGGFGHSPYLREQLDEYCKARDIWLTTPSQGAWSAVMRGAVLRGLEESVIRQRRSRKHYGIRLRRVYDKEAHKHIVVDGGYIRHEKDPVTGTRMLTGFMDWKFPKGQEMYHYSEFDISFHYSIGLDESKKCFQSITLYASGEDEPPEMYNASRIEDVGQVRFSLEDIDWESTLSTTASGQRYYCVNSTCRLRPADETGHMTMRVLQGGKEVGKATLQLE